VTAVGSRQHCKAETGAHAHRRDLSWGLLGRILPGIVVDFTSWRVATLAAGGLATIAAMGFAVWVPSPSVHRSAIRPRHQLARPSVSYKTR